MKRILVLGAGAMGSAFTVPCVDNNNDVVLVGTHLEDEAIENIRKEVVNAKKTFQKYKWPSIDVTRKSVEETAASIIKIHEIYLNNVK